MKYKVLLILFIISLMSSFTLSFEEVSEFCNPGEGCEVVHASEYNYTFGIQNSHYGILIFSLLILLTLSQMQKPKRIKENILHVSIVFGAIISIYFLYIQHFALNAYCKYCLLIDFSLLVALFAILPELKKDFKNFKR